MMRSRLKLGDTVSSYTTRGHESHDWQLKPFPSEIVPGVTVA